MFHTKASILVLAISVSGISSSSYGDDVEVLKKVIAVQEARIQEMESHIQQMQKSWTEKISRLVDQTNRRFNQLKIRIDQTSVNLEPKFLTLTEHNAGFSHTIAHCNQENAVMSYLRLWMNPNGWPSNPPYFDRIACATVDVSRGTAIDVP